MFTCARRCLPSWCVFNWALSKPILLFLFLTPLLSANAATVEVPAGGDLQAALNAAQPGDRISLAAGAIYTGNFFLPVKSGDEFITVQSSRCDELPSGVRVAPANASLMARLVTPDVSQVLTAPVGSHHFRFQCLEFTQGSSVGSWGYTLIKLGGSAGSENQTTLASVPHHLEFDRVIIRARDAQTELHRGVALNSAFTSITNSYIADIKFAGIESQAIAGWNGPGPYRIINNYIEAAGENVMFGGADPSISNLVPSDIEIRRNTFFKPLSWRVGDRSYGGYHWTVKNLLELKNARRVIIDGNTFENCWLDAQVGFAILIKSANQDGTCPWCVSEDVTFSNNIIRNVEHGINVLAYDTSRPSGQVKRLRVLNNLWENIRGMWFQGTDGADDVLIEHNTHLQQSGNVMTLYGQPTTNFVARNNLGVRTGYGIKGDGTGEGSVALATYGPAYVYVKNVLVGAPTAEYPAENFYPASLDGVGFVDRANGNYRLSESSPFHNAGTDGKDIGVDFAALNAALAGTPISTPSPSPNPTNNIRRAKRSAQDLSNSLSSSDAFVSTGMTLINTLVSELNAASTAFNALRSSYPRANEIDLELTRALAAANNVNTAALNGDLATLKIQLRLAIDYLALADVLINNPTVTNPVDDPGFMVRQNYLDFLNREPDAGGEEFWTNNIIGCGSNAQCTQAKRVHVSAAFFLSIECQQTGYYVYRLYKSSFGRLPTMTEFMPDTVMIGRGVIVGSAGWQDRLTANKQEFVAAWIQRPAFQARYGGMSNDQFVNSLIANLGVTIDLNERNALVQSLNNGASRATVVEQLATNPAFTRAEFNPAFVLMEYFGYLRRDPDAAGFNFWLNKLNQFNGNYSDSEMVRAFLESIEYRQRFRF